MLNFQAIKEIIKTNVPAQQIIKINDYATTITLQGKGEIKVRFDSLGYVEVTCDANLRGLGQITHNYFEKARNLGDMMVLVNKYL